MSEENDNKGSALSIRKVVYRALLARRLPSHERPDRDDSGIPLSEIHWSEKRIGRLSDSSYQSFNQYLRIATAKLGILPGSSTVDTETPMTEEEKGLSRRLECLYVLRTFLGPVVESAIVLDRLLFLVDHLGPSDVRLVNLFDQSTGSLRNLALVWKRELAQANS